MKSFLVKENGAPARLPRLALVSLLAVVLGATNGVQQAPAATAAPADVNGFTAGNAAITSVDLAGRWSFTPAGRATTSITVPAASGCSTSLPVAIR